MGDLAARFTRDGFVVLESALAVEALAPVRTAAARIVDEFDLQRHRTVFRTDDRDTGRDEAFLRSAFGVHCFLEQDAVTEAGELLVEKPRAINKIGHAMHDLVPEFNSFCRLPLFTETLREVGMCDPLLWQTMYIFKQPKIGGEVRWHQDASYLISDPATVVGYWIAMEDSTLENGCLWVKPGAHRTPLREIYEVDWSTRTGALRTLDETPWPDLKDAQPLEVPAGSVVLFHDHLPHYSSRNSSPISREALTIHMAERSSEWSAANWLQRGSLPPFAMYAEERAEHGNAS
jgi:phytanoyl-CoA hydroxylase